MKIGILTTAYKRESTNKAFCLMIDRLRNDFINLFLPVAVVGRNEDAGLFVEYGIDTYVMDNRPLASKWNFGLKKLQDRVDNVLILDSDDLINNNYICQLIVNSDKDMVWCRGVYFLSIDGPYKGLCRYWSEPYRESGTTGILLSSNLLDKTDWKIYEGHEDNKMGYYFYNYILPYITSRYQFELKPTGSILLDIKSEDSLNKFGLYINNGVNIPLETLYKFFSEPEQIYLRQLLK